MKNEVQRLKMETKHKVEEHIEIIGKLFPNTLTEVIKGYNAVGDPIMKSAIDFDVLRQELSEVLVEGPVERYQMNWPDKRKSILLANTPTNMTLRPCREESVDFDRTENLYIEGNNLEVLKLLQETYLNKVKMIYIDPPYNTGNDSFTYDDNFKIDSQSFSEMSGKYDTDGNVIFDIRENNETNGRFHTDWLNMIYPRLKVAKDLLKEDGVIFISIDDNEVDNLKKICDEIFGEANFIANIIWNRKRGRDNSAKWFSKSHEYLLVYAKYKPSVSINYLELDEETKKAYKNPDNDVRGVYRMLATWARGTQGGVEYEFVNKEGQIFEKRLWLFSKENLTKLDKENKLIVKGDNIYRKLFLDENKGKIPETIWSDVSNAANASDEIKKLFDSIIFATPKPIPYIKQMLKIITSSDDLVLDFFSGSATTAHAVMELNNEDDCKRKFIMVQIPEEPNEKSEGHKAGYTNICEIGKERIRRAGTRIKGENCNSRARLDVGFRVLKLDSSNMKDIYYKPNDYSQEMLGEIQENIKEHRTSEDLLFQVMLELGELLSSSIEECTIAGKKVFIVGEGNIIACFDTGVTEEVVIEIAKRKPYYAIFRDSSIATDSVAANFEQIFHTYSPTTIRKVL